MKTRQEAIYFNLADINCILQERHHPEQIYTQTANLLDIFMCVKAGFILKESKIVGEKKIKKKK